MGQPRDRAIQVGETAVYAKYTSADPYQRDDRWFARTVELGTNGRISTAKLEFDRARLLRDPSIGEPIVNPDSRFMLGYRDVDQVSTNVFFEGIPVNVIRIDQGAVGAQKTIGQMTLKNATELYRQHPMSQITGAYMPRIPDLDQSIGFHVLDESVPVVFNPDNLPNRSFARDDEPAFMDILRSRETYYFVAPDGFDIESTNARISPKYWTYAQAIAYLLCWYTDDHGFPTETSTRHITMDFGVRDGDDDFLWDCIGPHLDTDPPADDGTGLTNFNVSPSVLLTQKVPGIDVTGMNVIDAIGRLLNSAGLGWFTDFRTETGDIDSAPLTPNHKFRVFTPGGENVSGGKGAQYVPSLEPYNVSVNVDDSPREVSDYLLRNNLSNVDARFDMNEIVNHPMVRAAPGRFEITVELRPMWRPIVGEVDGSGAAFIDNVDPFTFMTLANYEGTVTMQDVALAELNRALMVHRGLPSIFNDTSLTGEPGRRADWLAKSLIASATDGAFYYDTLRKWGIPTDHSWPDVEYARDSTIASVPSEWYSYRPFNFATTSGLISTPIPEAEQWPTRRRPFLPLLIKDQSGNMKQPVVEVSFNSGQSGTWFEWPSISFDPEDSVLYLQFENPTDVQAGAVSEGTPFNLAQAYMKNQLRVRVTCTIEGSSPTVVVPPAIDATALKRAQVFDSPGIRNESVISRFQNQTVPNSSGLSDPSSQNTGPDQTDNKFFIFTPKDVSGVLRSQANQIQAIAGYPQVHGTLKIPWIELDVDIGSVVPRVDDVQIGDSISGLQPVPRNLDFRFEIRQGMELAPSVAGIVYYFESGNYTTDVVLSDWRTIDGV